MKHLKIVLLCLIAVLFVETGAANAIMLRSFCVDSTLKTFTRDMFGKPPSNNPLDPSIVVLPVDGSTVKCPEGMKHEFGSISSWRGSSSLPSAWLNREVALVLMFFALSYALGRFVQSGRLNANNTRKFLGIGMIIAPLLAPYNVAATSNSQLMLASYLIFLVCLFLFAERIRKRSRFLQTAFAAIDRPEDRPHTFYWFTMAYVASSAVILGAVFFGLKQHLGYVAVVVFAVTLADIVSGLVGFRFGRMRYKVPSLARGKSYTRSLEGSLALYSTVLVVIYILSAALPSHQVALALIVLPLAITVAEMISPHTWDDPIMLAAGMGAAMVISG